MKTFTGNYFDAKSGKSYPAQINLTPTALQIAFKTSLPAVPTTVYWQVHRLEKVTDQKTRKTIIQYGKYPGQTLEINDPDFITTFEKYYAPAPEISITDQNTNNPKRKGLGAIYLFFIFLFALIPLTYFWILPAAADMAARRIPFAYEQKLGKTLQEQLIPERKINQSKTASLKRFMGQLNLGLHTEIQVFLMQDSVPNAFALPGGTIVVNQAMLPLLNSPEELAALLGHEYGHIVQRHSVRTLFRTVSGYLLISFVVGDVSAITAIILQNAHAFKSMAYSREFEKEADNKGFDILLKNKLNPEGMIQLFKQLQQQKVSEENEYLSSHPLLSARISHIQKLMAQEAYQIEPNDSLNFYFKQLKQEGDL